MINEKISAEEREKLKSLRKQIRVFKLRLRKEAVKRGIYENFGANECRELKEKYDPNFFCNYALKGQVLIELKIFEDWCASFDIRYS